MTKETKDELELALIACAKKAKETARAIDALQYTQAALNAANALVCLESNFSETATEFSRQGLSTKEVLKRTTDALILSHLASVNASDSVKELTTIVESLDLEQL